MNMKNTPIIFLILLACSVIPSCSKAHIAQSEAPVSNIEAGASDASSAESGAEITASTPVTAASIDEVSVNSQEEIKNYIQKIESQSPDFKVLDSVLGTKENEPILFAAVALNQKDNLSSELFIFNSEGYGQVNVASGLKAYYQEAAGIHLDKNHVKMVVNVITKDGENKIMDVDLKVDAISPSSELFNIQYTNYSQYRPFETKVNSSLSE